jgi:hypothetical protein
MWYAPPLDRNGDVLALAYLAAASAVILFHRESERRLHLRLSAT